jgi:hypothetical protein
MSSKKWIKTQQSMQMTECLVLTSSFPRKPGRDKSGLNGGRDKSGLNGGRDKSGPYIISPFWFQRGLEFGVEFELFWCGSLLVGRLPLHGLSGCVPML